MKAVEMTAEEMMVDPQAELMVDPQAEMMVDPQVEMMEVAHRPQLWVIQVIRAVIVVVAISSQPIRAAMVPQQQAQRQ